MEKRSRVRCNHKIEFSRTWIIYLGVFYEYQLQKAEEPEIYKIEKVLRWRKTPDGNKQALVRWLGYGPKFDQWVDEAELVNV